MRVTNKDLNDLAKDFVNTMFVKPKKKKLRPLIKQTTYNGTVKKWSFDGAFINIVGGRSYDWDIIKDNYIDKNDFVISLIKKEVNK